MAYDVRSEVPRQTPPTGYRPADGDAALWTLLLAPALAATAEVATITDAPRIDGALDEPAWSAATPITTFERFLPTAGGAPAEQIEVRFLQDAWNLYVGVRVVGAAAPIRARVSPREDINSDDQIGLYLDPFHDGRTGFIFYLNPLGIQQDIRFDNGDWDVRWSTVMRSRGHVHDDGHGFDLEIAIPFRSLKYPREVRDQTWGVILTRKVPSEGAKYSFPHTERGFPRLFLQAAALDGVRPPVVGSGVELIAGLAVRAEQSRPDGGDLRWQWFDPWHESLRPSLDLRAGIGTNIGLAAAINPDFSQVESDVAPVVLNRRFAWQFAEQRPVFTEGANWLDDDANTLYSRSVVEPLYVVKAGGREGAWSLGAMNALDRAPTSSFHEAVTPGFEEADLSGAWASSSVVRIRRDLPGAGQVGVTFADKRVVQPGAEPIPGLRRGAADNFGVDATVPFGERWTALARHDQSFVSGGSDFLGGSNTALRVARASGDGLGLDAQVGFVSEDYRQELGFRTQSGSFTGATSVDWTFGSPGERSPISTIVPRIDASVFEQVNGEHFRVAGASTQLVFNGIHTLTLGAGGSHRREISRGVDGRVAGWWANAAYAGQIGAAVEWSPSINVEQEMDFADLMPTRRVEAQLTTSLRPLRPLRIDLLGRWLHFDRPTPRADGVDQGDDLLLRARVQAQFTTQFGMRLIEAYNLVSLRGGSEGTATAGTEPTLETNVLLFWQLHPFTAVWLGYAERDVLGSDARTLERSLFAKFTVWTRL